VAFGDRKKLLAHHEKGNGGGGGEGKKKREGEGKCGYNYNLKDRREEGKKPVPKRNDYIHCASDRKRGGVAGNSGH